MKQSVWNVHNADLRIVARRDGVRFCTSILTDTFQVYSSKRFPGMSRAYLRSYTHPKHECVLIPISESTTESREAAAQGLRLRIRRPKKCVS